MSPPCHNESWWKAPRTGPEVEIIPCTLRLIDTTTRLASWLHSTRSASEENEFDEKDDDDDDDEESNDGGHSILRPYGMAYICLTLLTLAVIILVTVIGNAMVVAAVIVERNLRNVSNYLTASLAVADLLVAVLVMPLAAVNEVSTSWFLGRGVCDMWTSFDVLCCTSSILHLVAISLDRYWAVTRVDYIHNRSARRILIMIGTSWGLSVIISIPLLFIDKDTAAADHVFQCIISQDRWYTIFSTVGAFYLPLALMVIIYHRVFKAARLSIRKKRFRAFAVATSSGVDGGTSGAAHGPASVAVESGIDLPSNISRSPSDVGSAPTSISCAIPTIEVASVPYVSLTEVSDCPEIEQMGNNTLNENVVRNNSNYLSNNHDIRYGRSDAKENCDRFYETNKLPLISCYETPPYGDNLQFVFETVGETPCTSPEGDSCDPQARSQPMNNLQVSEFNNHQQTVPRPHSASKMFSNSLTSHMTVHLIEIDDDVTCGNLYPTQMTFPDEDDDIRSMSVLGPSNRLCLELSSTPSPSPPYSSPPRLSVTGGTSNDDRNRLLDTDSLATNHITSNISCADSLATNHITCKISGPDRPPPCSSSNQLTSNSNPADGNLTRRWSDEVSSTASKFDEGSESASLFSPRSHQGLGMNGGSKPFSERKPPCSYLQVSTLSPQFSGGYGGEVGPESPMTRSMGSRRGSWLDLTKQYFTSTVLEHRRGTKEAVAISPRTRERRAREKIEQRRERKAARTLAIVTGSFILCWLPFFILAVVMPFCGDLCHVPDLLMSVIGWLGYFNSLLNPIIYTVFNPDFRLAFHKMIFGRYRARRRRNGVDYRHSTAIRLTSVS